MCQRKVCQHLLSDGAGPCGLVKSGVSLQRADHGLTTCRNVGKPLSAARWQAGSIERRKTGYPAQCNSVPWLPQLTTGVQ